MKTTRAIATLTTGGYEDITTGEMTRVLKEAAAYRRANPTATVHVMTLSDYDGDGCRRILRSQKWNPIAPKASATDGPAITEASRALFVAYADDAGNWSGFPMVGGNVGGSKEDRGNLTQLKKAGLITTWTDEGLTWISFTESGKAFAKECGIDLSWIK